MFSEQLINLNSASLINSFINIKMSCYTKKTLGLFLDAFSEDIDLNYLGQKIGISKFNLIRAFKKDCGISPIKWLWIYRTVLSSKLIQKEADWTIKDISNICGFLSSSHYCRCFKKVFKISPTEYKRRYVYQDFQESIGRHLVSTLILPQMMVSKKMALDSLKMTNLYICQHLNLSKDMLV